MRPRFALRVAFPVHAGLFGDDAQAIGRFDHGGTAGAMPPAHEVAARVLHQLEREKVHPVRLRRAQSRPLVRRLLSPPVQLQVVAVDVEAGCRVPADRPYAQRNFARIQFVAADLQPAHYAIDVGMRRLPKLRHRQLTAQMHLRAAARHQFAILAQFEHFLPIRRRGLLPPRLRSRSWCAGSPPAPPVQPARSQP